MAVSKIFKTIPLSPPAWATGGLSSSRWATGAHFLNFLERSYIFEILIFFKYKNEKKAFYFSTNRPIYELTKLQTSPHKAQITFQPNTRDETRLGLSRTKARNLRRAPTEPRTAPPTLRRGGFGGEQRSNSSP